MTNETAMVKPTNKIVLDSKGIHIQTKKVETVTNMYAGRLVKRGTNDDDVVVAAAATDQFIGWLGYEQTAKKYRPASVTTIYVASDQASVINGPGIILTATVQGGSYAPTKGARFKAGTAGCLSAGTDGTDHIVAIAEESATCTAGSGGTATILVRSLI